MYSKTQINIIDKYIKIIVDSREQKNQHILNFFEVNNINYEIKKLDFGDYSFEMDDNNIIGKINFEKFRVIERKNSLLELSGNLFKNRDRFERELNRKGKTNFTLMIEETESIENIYKGYYRSRKQRISIEKLINKLETLKKTGIKMAEFSSINNMLYDLNDYIPKTNANSYIGSLLALEQRYNFNTVFIPDKKMSGKYIYDIFKYYLREIMNKKNKIEEEKFLTH
jgi:hypothetical protein